MKNLRCPQCGEQLTRELTCTAESCGFSDRYSIYPNRQDSSAVAIEMSRRPDIYIDESTMNLYIGTSPINLIGRRAQGNEEIAVKIRRRVKGLTKKNFPAALVNELIDMIGNDETPIPRIKRRTGFPLLDKNLRFTFTSSDCSRACEGFYYTGEPLVPKEHGGIFEEWLQSFRCNTETDRKRLRAWLLSLHLQTMLGPGMIPALLLMAPTGTGSGKTASAHMISQIFGGGAPLQDCWASNTYTEQNLSRKLIGSPHRFYVVDNLAPYGHYGFIDNSNLAEYLTKRELATMRLYSSGGTVSVPKYNLDIITANSPVLSLELLERTIPVQLNKNKGCGSFPDGWEKYWVERRKEILEESLWTVINNYEEKDYDYGEYPVYKRFVEWATVACRASGESIAIDYMEGIGSPLDCALEVCFSAERGKENIRVEDVVTTLKTAAGPAADSVRRERPTLDVQQLKTIIKYWSTKYDERNDTIRKIT